MGGQKLNFFPTFQEGDFFPHPRGGRIWPDYLRVEDRLKHREMIPELLKLKTMREELFQQRLKQSKQNKSPAWTMQDLDKVLSHLKNGKSADPTGLVNELFASQNIGDNLKQSILLLMNKIKMIM